MSGVFEVDALDCRIVAYDWPFSSERRAEIDAHWDRLRSANPALYDGNVFLINGWSIERCADGAVLRSRHFPTRFRDFLAWRDFGFPDAGIANCFAAAALSGSDGGYVLGEMNSHTANAGRIYFPAGTPDPQDDAGGYLDLEASVLRELEEETGLTRAEVSLRQGWTLISDGPRLACLKHVSSSQTAAALASRIEGFLAREDRPEFARIHRIYGRDQIVAAMPDYIRRFLTDRLAR